MKRRRSAASKTKDPPKKRKTETGIKVTPPKKTPPKKRKPEEGKGYSPDNPMRLYADGVFD